MDVYATHLPILLAMVSKSNGPILEMGCGDFSTYILHEVCKVTKRKLISAEEKSDWFQKFTKLATLQHEFHLVGKWEDFKLIDEIYWGLVFVDHAPGERRKFDIDRLRNNADYLVIHDTEETGYKYEPILQTFKYRFDYKIHRPWTTVVSEKFSLDFLKD